jgi:hypothetical protein
LVNDQHAHAGYVGHDGTPTGSYDTDPLFGAGHSASGAYEPGHSGQYDSTQWGTGSHDTSGYGGFADTASGGQALAADRLTSYDSGAQWDTTAWDAASATTGGFETGSFGTGEFGTGEFTAGQFGTAHFGTGQFDADRFATGQFDTGATTAAAFSPDSTGQWEATGYETGTYDASAWNGGTAESLTLVPQQYVPEQEFTGEFTAAPDAFGEYAGATGEYAHGFAADFTPETDSTFGGGFGYEEHGTAVLPEFGAGTADGPVHGAGDGTEDLAHQDRPEHFGAADPYESTGYYGDGTGDTAESGHDAPHDDFAADGETDPGHPDDALTGHTDGDGTAESGGGSRTAPPAAGRSARRSPGGAPARSGGRGRRRTPARRSAMLTIAVPSACAMGVAAIAAASVGSMGDEPKSNATKLAAADTSLKEAAANSKLDTQLAALSAEARDFGDRASRTQERIDLKARQEAERKKRAEAAALKERLRPKFALPVQQKGLSTYFGQSGVNWMALHTGIDFPVALGTPVMAATDGTVRTDINRAYGNMVILTAPDGTETWYCHLSSAKIRSGKVKAGDVIAYSGDTGNSTGPHLHFEVRPGGGAPINPLTWFQKHGLSPV